MFLTRLSERDARSQNVVKLSPGYCIKQIDFILPWVCTLITHRGRQNMVRTSVTLLACGSYVLTSSVRYQSTDARQNEIYLLNRLNNLLLLLLLLQSVAFYGSLGMFLLVINALY